ncbi:signal transduction histidine kinase/DNA-binding response OmpR family regulator/CHASE3 domain sensor protein/HAMP domain-containing protein [Pedobacter cryoconitis]|uniref:histidine kinase n=2 Tax=Pedobacter cryoconitis TaxID=188932 RepID=A0A7X0J306_9SPHI|nr:response regulator [Pedobacter cryoconitis]MBB6499507.1 signal transduction histidine kinase/DNA-binding response OmpR family regulator/CHASE3 domain sensor protein/HAMP domain-containing protein [Pedobacter cryoconitis]
MMQRTLKNNLRFGLGLSLLLLFISSAASYVSISNLIKNSKLVSHSHSIITNTDGILSTLKDAETGQRGFLLTGDEVFLDPYKGAKAAAILLLDTVQEQTTDNPEQLANISKLREIIEGRLNILEKTIEIKRRGGSVSTGELLIGKEYMDKARKVIKRMQIEEQNLLDVRTANQNKLAGYTPVLILFAALMAFLITIFFYRRVSSDFNVRVKLQLQQEETNKEIERRIQVIQDLAGQISKGNYEIRLDEEAKDDLGRLGGSLNAMAESLNYSFTLLGDKEWLQTGIANLNDQMVGEKNLDTLAHDVLETIIQHTGAQVAAFYLLEEDRLLHLTGSYALEEDQRKQILKQGEGLVGQVLKSGKQILLNDIPEGEMTISYAAGNTRPKNIVAVPVIRNKRVVGVMELGSMNTFSPLQLDFFNTISENIGVAVYAAQNRKRLQDFLEETQAQAEELQAQHSELEGLNAELEAQTQKIQTSEEELRVQQEELLQSNQELEERTTLLEEKNQLIHEHNLEIQQKSEQLEQSTKYKSEFLANMSHELRTPLNSILLLSKLMSENESLDPEYVEYAEVIQSSGQGLLGLIDEILDLSKIEAGKMKLELTDVSLNEVSSDMRSLFNPIAKNKNLDLRINIEGDNLTLYTDKMRLEQILKNLLSNAIKFTSKGSVTLDISNDSKQRLLLFKVTDTGIGIPAAKQGLVFEAFQQADGSTRRKFGGTGLGLSISRELAKLLGGEIELTSTEHKGSTFLLSLPVDGIAAELEEEIYATADYKAEPVKEPALTILPERFTVDRIPQEIEDDRENIVKGDKVILIIEDDTAFAKTLLSFTRKRNYKGIVAVRGDIGIDMANHFKPLAILLDIQLPIKDGWQVMEELKANPATRPIPVHIMSSLEVKKESLLKGAVDFINKPVALEHMKQIFQKLEDALSRHPKKVLIVEENEQHAKALSYFLSNHDIQTEVVNNVSQSVDALHKKEVDCVILDMGIPDKNAYLTLETIKKSEGLENLPIIIFTGKNLSQGEERRIKQYADSIVVKTAHSYQRILDEAGLFLHLVEEKSGESKSKKASEGLGGLYEVLNNKTVLIADDDVRNIFSLTKALEQHKMKVLAATDGKEALQLLKENPSVDIVLMDMMMPEMDGYESTKEIRKINALKHLPVLAVTAKAMMGDREKCIAAGASDYISKPVDVDQLISLLRVWLYDKN